VNNIKGKVDKCRKARGREWDRQQLNKYIRYNKKSKIISYHVSINNINIYLANSGELIPENGKFEVYKPKKK